MEATIAKIKKQVEFYFSDSNIVTDTFLKNKIETTEGGWVAASVIASFKRAQGILKEGNVAEDAAAKFICDAVKDSEVIEVDSEKLQLRRKSPIPEKTDADNRKVYVKGWPREPEPTLEAVSDFYTAQGVKVLSVRLRRSQYGRYRNHFKGTLVVEVATTEQAADLLAKKPRPEGGAEEMIYQDYLTFKAEKEKEEAEHAAARATSNAEAPAAKRARKEEAAAAEVTVTEKPEPHKQVPNCVVRITGMPANMRGKEIKLELLKIAEVLFVEIEGEDEKKEGEEEEKKEEEKKEVTVIARCKDERNSSKLVEELNSKGFKDAKVQASLLQGEEEKAFWDKAIAAMNAADSSSGRGRGGKRGGRGRGRGHRGRH